MKDPLLEGSNLNACFKQGHHARHLCSPLQTGIDG